MVMLPVVSHGGTNKTVQGYLFLLLQETFSLVDFFKYFSVK